MRKKVKNQYPLLPIDVTSEQLVRKLHSFEGRVAGFITRFSGSMYFVYFHVVWFGAWIVLNHPFFKIKAFDPFPYGLLTMIVSLEAIFLSTFIMINQNRQALVDTVRELEEDEEEQQEEKEQEELEEDVEDIQQDLDDIKNAMAFIQQKINDLEKSPQASSEKSKS
ncbi:MAG: DUF1003 domain-containing protein [Patescibacteria group bacterium]